jgi:hypothetical protein
MEFFNKSNVQLRSSPHSLLLLFYFVLMYNKSISLIKKLFFSSSSKKKSGKFPKNGQCRTKSASSALKRHKIPACSCIRNFKGRHSSKSVKRVFKLSSLKLYQKRKKTTENVARVENLARHYSVKIYRARMFKLIRALPFARSLVCLPPARLTFSAFSHQSKVLFFLPRRKAVRAEANRAGRKEILLF